MNRYSILEILKKSGQTTEGILDILIGGFSYKKLKRKALYPTMPDFLAIKNRRKPSKKQKYNNFYSLLSQLKKQGFIKKQQKNGKSYWLITTLGQKRVETIKDVLPLPKFIYRREKDDGLNIIAFDIPEIEKRKRNWLRHVLLGLGFKMLQKSVWIGKNKLPENFLRDLKELNLLDFIHIFKVSTFGTIKVKNIQ